MRGIYVRGDFAVCSSPLSLESYNICQEKCRYCFIKTLQKTMLKNKAELGQQYQDTKAVDTQLKHLLNEKATSPESKMLRLNHPLTIGRKSEPFNALEKTERVTKRCIGILADYGVTVTAETKGWVDATSQDGLAGVNYSCTPGDEAYYANVEPDLPGYAERIKIMRDIKASGIKLFVKGEPIIPYYANKPGLLEQWVRDVADVGADAVNFGPLKVTSMKLVYEEFQHTNEPFAEVMKSNLDWELTAKKLFELTQTYGLKHIANPDWLFTNNTSPKFCENCCGYDAYFPFSHFTMEYAAKHLRETGRVTWNDVLKQNHYFDPSTEEVENFRAMFNGKPGYFNLGDLKGFGRVEVDENGNTIWGKPKSLGNIFGKK